MGLLDMMNDDGFRLGLGLLAAGGARSDGAGIGQRLAEGVGSLDAFKANQQRQKMAAMQGQMMQAQLDAQQRQYEAAQAQAQREAVKQAALPEIFSPGSAGAPSFSVDQSLPPEMRAGTPPVAAMAPRQAGIDVQRALMAGYSPEEIGKLDALRNIGKNEVARTIKGLQGGREVEQQFDKYGQPIGSGFEQFRAPIEVNQGDRRTFVDPYTLEQRASMAVNQDANSKASNAVAWANNALSRERLSFDKNGGAETGPGQMQFVQQFGKPMPGYRWKADGSMEPIPGGPADIKAGQAGAAEEKRKAFGDAAANNVLGAVKDAKQLVGINTAGMGSTLSKLPGTDARDLSAKLETVKANLGFDRLQQMRDMSPTGGALGSVAVQELTALQSTVSSLDQGQSPAELRKSLAKIEGHYKKWMDTVNAAQSGDKSGSSQKFDMLPNAEQFSGKRMRADNGTTYRSDGTKWIKE